MVVYLMKEELKCVSMEYGVVYVMTVGIYKTDALCNLSATIGFSELGAVQLIL